MGWRPRGAIGVICDVVREPYHRGMVKSDGGSRHHGMIVCVRPAARRGGAVGCSGRVQDVTVVG